MEQATPRACQRTNETPDAAGHSIYGGLYWWRQVVVPWVLNHAPQKWICLRTTLKYFLVPLFHFSFWHWDMRRVLLVHRFLESSVWKIYLHYFAKKKSILVINISDFFFKCLLLKEHLYRDAFSYTVFAHCCVYLPLNIRMLLLWKPFHALDSSFFFFLLLHSVFYPKHHVIAA